MGAPSVSRAAVAHRRHRHRRPLRRRVPERFRRDAGSISQSLRRHLRLQHAVQPAQNPAALQVRRRRSAAQRRDTPVPISPYWAALKRELPFSRARQLALIRNSFERDVQLKAALGFPASVFTRAMDVLRPESLRALEQAAAFPRTTSIRLRAPATAPAWAIAGKGGWPVFTSSAAVHFQPRAAPAGAREAGTDVAARGRPARHSESPTGLHSQSARASTTAPSRRIASPKRRGESGGSCGDRAAENAVSQSRAARNEPKDGSEKHPTAPRLPP